MASKAKSVTYVYDGIENNKRGQPRKLAGYVPAEGSEPVLEGGIWLRRSHFPDGLPQTIDVTVRVS